MEILFRPCSLLYFTPCGSRQNQSTWQPGSCSWVKIMKRTWLIWNYGRCLNTSVSIPSSLNYRSKFWYPGEAGPQLVLMIIFITNNGGPTEHMFSVISGEISIITEIFLQIKKFNCLAVFSAGSLVYGIFSSGMVWSETDEWGQMSRMEGFLDQWSRISDKMINSIFD